MVKKNTSVKITANTVSLPENETSWKNYTIALLNKMDENKATAYRKKFKKSIIFWRKCGGSLDDSIIAKLDELNIRYAVKGVSKHGKRIVVLKQTTPDDTASKILAKVPSWKRMCMCILKNDTDCSYMGF